MEESSQAVSTSKNFSDKELIALINTTSGTELSKFQTAFYKRHVGYVYKVATLKSRNFSDPQQLAKDITQETFMVVFDQLKDFSFDPNIEEIEYIHVLKGWFGQIANIRFLKIYTKYIKHKDTENDTSLRSRDETICPMCGTLLVEDKKEMYCPSKHYRATKEDIIPSEAGTDTLTTDDLFESLYGTKGEIPTTFRLKLQEAMNTLSEKQRHILLTYASEGCLGSTKHLSPSTLADLCSAYNTVPDTIKHIKNRAYNKLNSICFPTQKK